MGVALLEGHGNPGGLERYVLAVAGRRAGDMRARLVARVGVG